MAAMTTLNQIAPVCEFVLSIDLPPKQDLDSIPRLPIHKRFVPTGKPLALVFNFADVRAVT